MGEIAEPPRGGNTAAPRDRAGRKNLIGAAKGVASGHQPVMVALTEGVGALSGNCHPHTTLRMEKIEMADEPKAKKSLVERTFERHKKIAHGDPDLWRHPIINALMALLEAGKLVTAETLIASIKSSARTNDPALREGVLEAAIERLTKFVVPGKDSVERD